MEKQEIMFINQHLKKHLHFIVSIDDKTVNPDKYFNQKLKKLRQHHDKFIFIKKLVSFVFLLVIQ